MYAFKDMVVVVTGAGSGIGKTTAEMFLANGATVVGVVRRKEMTFFTEKRSEYPDSCFTEHMDVSISDQVQAGVGRILDRFGKIDVLVNCAGVLINATVTETTEEQWDTVFASNVKSVYLMCRESLPSMRKRQTGTIINVASRVGMTGGPNLAAYCASKAAVANLTREMALDYSPEGIRIVAVAPGKVETAMCDMQFPGGEDDKRKEMMKYPQRRFTQTEEVANVILFLASEYASNMTGVIIPVDGGRSAY